MGLVVREPVLMDHDVWRSLFTAYQNFYRGHITDDAVECTWDRILDPIYPMGALVVEQNDRLVGFAHFLYHDSTWNSRKSCYLEDLFVEKAFRGHGAARLLIEGVEQTATIHGAFRLYWHTQQYNGAARSLYDSIMPPSSFMVYRKNL